MQKPKNNSTLDLVTNVSQNQQNLSQVDLRPDTSTEVTDETKSNGQTKSFINFYFDPIKKIPSNLIRTCRNKIDEAKKNSTTKAGFFVGITQWLSGTLIWTICFFLTVAVPLILTLIGLINLNSCDAKPSLPYLVFGTGFVMTCSNLFNLAMSLNLPLLSNHKILTNDLKNIIANLANIIFNIFVATLYVLTATSVLTMDIVVSTNKTQLADNEESTIYSETKQNYIENVSNCDNGFYNFTHYFIVTTLSLIVILSVVSALAFVYNRYKKAIERGMVSKSQPEP